MTAPNLAKQPWKHPAVWPAHLVRRSADVSKGVYVRTDTCECGWCACAAIDRSGAGHVAQDDAVDAHWQSVIAEAEPVPA